MEVNLENLALNFRSISGSLDKGCSLMAVVKANGYGLGARRVAKVFQEAGCQRFAVATPDEAVELRENGISEPLLVMGPSSRDAAEAFVAMDITAACTDLSFAEAMSRAAVTQGKTARLHLKVDTGMGRIGFLPGDIPETVDRILHFPGSTSKVFSPISPAPMKGTPSTPISSLEGSERLWTPCAPGMSGSGSGMFATAPAR
jgi:alanine racemase